MILDLKKYISARCPTCGERSYNEVTPFMINKGYVLTCDTCESSFAELHKSNNGYLIKISCFICDEIHEFFASFNGIWKKNLLTLGCPATGVDILYIGNKPDVYRNANETDELLYSDTEGIFESKELSDISPIFQSAVEIIHNRIMSGLVNCNCGKCEIILRIMQSNIVIICANCDAKCVVPMETSDDLNKLRNMQFIDLV